MAHCKQQLSGYKAPKHLVLVDRVVRSPAGKADYRWAADTAAERRHRVLTHGLPRVVDLERVAGGGTPRRASASVSSGGAW